MLELKNISYEVEDDRASREILKDVNLKIDNHFVAITGPNGGGKSTLAKIIAGIIRPTSGQILLDGEDITAYNITERAKAGISYAFQQPVHFKGLTVKELKRIEIAMITARSTKLSIFDEPEAGIDLWSFNSLIHVFERMHKEINGMILIISHQERILNIADEIILISDGRVMAAGNREEMIPKLLSTESACSALADKA